MNRAERRHRRQRKVAYARRKLREWGETQAAYASWWADNMAKCSCPMCKYDGSGYRREIDTDISNWMAWYEESK